MGAQLGIGSQIASRIPADAGQITIMKSDQLDAAQKSLKVLKALSWILIFAALAAFAGAIWLAPSGSRREALRIVACAFILVGILLLVIRKVAESYIVDALTSGESLRKAADATWLIGTSLLAQVAWSLIIYGVVALIGVVLAARTSGHAASAPGSPRFCATTRDRPGRSSQAFSFSSSSGARRPRSIRGSAC